MTIYRRTASGNEVALNPNSPLPRKLRTLLIAVDGKTPLGIYVNSLGSFGDVPALFESLEQAGLVAIVPAAGIKQAARPNIVASDHERQTQSTWNETRSGSSTLSKAPWSSDSVFDSKHLRSGNDTESMPPWGRSQIPSRAAFGTGFTSARSPGGTAEYQLRNAIQLMSDFVTRHLPEQSLDIVLSLESLGSVEQVVASLRGYEALISPVGPPAQRHLAELRTALATF